MTIFITTTDTNQWDEIVSSAQEHNVIEHLGLLAGTENLIVKEPVKLDELSSRINSLEHIVILYESPESYLSRILENSSDEGSLFDNCLSYLNGLTSIFKKNREKIQLLNLEKIDFCEKRDTSVLESIGFPTKLHFKPVSKNLTFLAAYFLIYEDESLSTAAEHLEACSLPLDGSKDSTKIFTLINNILIENEAKAKLARTYINDLEDTLENFKKENLTINNQLVEYKKDNSKNLLELKNTLSQSLAELKLLEAKNSDFHNYIRRLDSLLDKEMMKGSQLKTLVDELTSDKAEFERKISKLEANNRNLTIRLNEANNQLREASANFDSVNRELKGVRDSLYWRVTAPVRACSTRLKRKDAKLSEALKRDVNLLYSSDFFDADWYLTFYPDVRSANLDPAEHYLLHGASEGRAPSPAFDGQWYLNNHEDVALAGLNPLVHYLSHGIEEKRAIRPTTKKNER